MTDDSILASKLVDQICDQFESAWHDGRFPRIEDFLNDDVPMELRDRVLSELLLAEWDLRSDEVALGDYQHRFGEKSQLVEDLFAAWGSERRNEAKLAALDATVSPSDCDSLGGKVLPEDTEFAGYDLLEQLGHGGMGVVYRARQRQPDRIVALKMIRSGQLASADDVKRFHEEANLAANSDYEGVVPIFEVGEHNGRHFYTMKLVTGENLSDLLDEASMTTAEIVRIVAASARAMGRCHKRGVVHRDLKPSNIRIDTEGNPQILDFGLAKSLDGDSELTLAGDILGTPGYMSPEQAKGDSGAVGPSTDVYSLGAILYRGLVGRPPIEVDKYDIVGTIHRILEQAVDEPRMVDRQVPRALNTICMKCLQPVPQSRYADAGLLADDLERFIAGEPVIAQPPNIMRRFSHWARRHPGLAATWIALAVFYAYYLLVAVLVLNATTSTFHRTSLIVLPCWALGAWACQRWLTASSGSIRALFAWTALEAVMVTALVAAGDGPVSILAMLYYLLVAVSVLRSRVRIVLLATVLAVLGYVFQVLLQMALGTDLVPPVNKNMLFVIGLIVMGLIQHLSIRRSNLAAESRD